jgi:crossover junction endodeoxyribonuclease RuvC
MTILGIDPGLCITGWAVLSAGEILAYGAIRPPAKEQLSVRLQCLHDGIKNLIALHAISQLAIEAGYCGIDGNTALKLGMVRGAVIVAAGGLNVSLYPPASVKLFAAGKGNASKDEVVKAMQEKFPNIQFIGVGKYDIADAIATALCAGS